jgi:hypothetical protein
LVSPAFGRAGELLENPMKTQITGQYIFFTFIAVVATWLIHELSHWSMGTVLGYDMQLTLNSAITLDGSYSKKWHEIFVRASGPVVTIIQAFIVFILLVKRPVYTLFPFLFTPFYMRLMASIMNFFNLNDEGNISHDLGIGTYTIPIIISSLLLVLVLIIAKKWAYSKKFIIWTTLLIIIFSSILILADQAFQIKLL